MSSAVKKCLLCLLNKTALAYCVIDKHDTQKRFCRSSFLLWRLDNILDLLLVPRKTLWRCPIRQRIFQIGEKYTYPFLWRLSTDDNWCYNADFILSWVGKESGAALPPPKSFWFGHINCKLFPDFLCFQFLQFWAYSFGETRSWRQLDYSSIRCKMCCTQCKVPVYLCEN